MKSMLVIGLGDYGRHLCAQLVHMKNEVMAIDIREDALEEVREYVSSAMVADCTSRSVLEKLGVRNFDCCFVCIGSDFRSNILIVHTLKDLGAKYVVSETNDGMLEELLLNNGADEIIHPNMDSAIRAAVKFSDEHIFDYLHLKGGYAIYEITPVKAWIGKNLMDAQIRANYNTTVLCIYHADGRNEFMPNPQTVIREDDKLMVLANQSIIGELLRKM